MYEPAVSTTAFTVIVAVAKSFFITVAVISEVAPVIVVSAKNSPVASFTTIKFLALSNDTNVADIAVELLSNPVIDSPSVKLPIDLSFIIIELGKLNVGLGDAS